MNIAITGSIATGKSAVTSYLKAKGYPVVDADVLSRALTAEGGAALPAIREAFGDAVFSGDALDRKALGARVFSDLQARERLEAILHPMILAQIEAFLAAHANSPVPVFADIPLLFECGWEGRFQSVWVVACAPETQLARLMARDQLDREQAQARIDAQMPLSEKTVRGEVLQNDGTRIELYRQIDALLALHMQVRPSPQRAKSPKSRRRPLLPRALGVAIVLLLAALLTTCTVAITRAYLARLEAQRRAEAAAAELAQHPLYYEDALLHYAEVQGLNPALVAAVILCESSFNPSAVSRLGARGLMQLMEDTAGWIAHRLDEDEGYAFDLLFDPETNIRYGSWYLGYLSRRFNGDPVKVVCAYHAGQGNVDSWLKNPDYSSDGVTLDRIPTQDTAQYCRRVLTAAEVYQRRYFTPATSAPEGGAP